MKRTPLRRKTPLRAKRRAMKSSIAVFERVVRSDPRIQLAIEHRVKAVTKKTKHARRERAPEEWWFFVKSQPCFVAWLVMVGAWDGPVTPCSCEPMRDADHMGDRFKDGDGTRALDATCVSICHGHHLQRHTLTGAFKLFDGERMQAFCSTGVQWMQGRARQVGITIPNC